MNTRIKKMTNRFQMLCWHTLFIAGIFLFMQSCLCEKAWRVKPAGNLVTVIPQGDNAGNFTAGSSCSFFGASIFYPRDSAQPPGDYFATTISAGPVMSFKNSEEEYGGGYGDHGPGIGLGVSIGTVLPFSQHFAIAPSVRFTQKKATETISYSEPGSSMEFKDTYTYNYAGAAMLAQYRMGKNLSLVAGPEVNFLLSSNVKFEGSSGSGEKESLTKSSNKVGVDLIAGIKYQIPTNKGRSKWGIQLLYDHRLSRLNKKKDETGFEMPAYKMKGVQLGLAYNFCNCGSKTKK